LGKPAARKGDIHSCPMVTPGGVPHEGGKIIECCQTVWIEGELAATLGDVCLCNGGFLDSITTGSSGVFIEGKPAVRQGDLCVHGGKITSGSATVLIGETMNPVLVSAFNEAENKSGFDEPSEEEKIVLINRAIQDCIALLERKLRLLEQGDTETLGVFQKWFGNVDDKAKRTILTRIERALELCRTLTIDNFAVIEDQEEKKGVYANSYPQDRFYSILLGDRFWEISPLSKKSKAGLIAHELSHFKEIGTTEDFIYGHDRCLKLAEDYPSLALYNAESFEYFMIS
jgi:uncharacterized Zn-binding protein involved in type VI secretion